MIATDLLETIKNVTCAKFSLLIKFDGEFLIRLIYNGGEIKGLHFKEIYINYFDFDRKKLCTELEQIKKEFEEEINLKIQKSKK